jgi:hypothetical protein
VYLGYYLHWSIDEILGLTHPARERVIEEVGKINAQLADGGS